MQHEPTASIETLKQRAYILRKLRNFFDSRGFIEVQTPTLSSETVVDRYINPIEVDRTYLATDNADDRARYFLQTSPEFAMKRLLAAGAEAIYQICPAYRAGESGTLHNPEFTMLEWYRVGDSMGDGVQLLSDLATSMLPPQHCDVVTYQDAFKKHCQIDPLSVPDDLLQEYAARYEDVHNSKDWDRDGLLNLILDKTVAPKLGAARPTILTLYPKSQAALAQISDADPRCAERFELFVDGVELANGYGELIEAEELLVRSRQENRARLQDGNHALPEPNKLYQSMRDGLPACSGCALGVDRLIKHILDLPSVEQAIAFGIRHS